ncbi:unnamed protein product [Rhizoctonia solani]|uniref:Galactose oxidase-like Early set domain-containing protein n=1 Tax=Rhizoctonia solani TaxID=456999 RepID=A0A8H3AMF2_9AGAM|nr:unnamed protein product [Rhizoctonia solani]
MYRLDHGPLSTEWNVSIHHLLMMVNYGATFILSVSIPSSAASVRVMLIDLGSITHFIHMGQKVVYLASNLSADRRPLTALGTPDAPVYSSGPGLIFVITNDVQSMAERLTIGTSASPPKDDAAIAK